MLAKFGLSDDINDKEIADEAEAVCERIDIRMPSGCGRSFLTHRKNKNAAIYTKFVRWLWSTEGDWLFDWAEFRDFIEDNDLDADDDRMHEILKMFSVWSRKNECYVVRDLGIDFPTKIFN